MLISQDRHPERNLYFLGAKIIEILSGFDTKIVAFCDLWKALKKCSSASVGLCVLSLDWLFLIGVIESTDNGDLKKCF